MKRLNYSKMENVTKETFEIEGVLYRKPTLEEYKKQTGTSAQGRWQIFTDENEYYTVYKKDVLKVSHDYALLIFH